MEILLLIICSFWVLFTVIGHLGINKMNFLSDEPFIWLIPKWNFFAPNPSTSSFYILFRYKYENDECSNWKQLYKTKKRKRLIRWLWQPENNQEKANFDIISEMLLVIVKYKDNPEFIKLSSSYLSIINSINEQERFEGCKEIQFTLYRNKMHLEQVFISNFHKLN